MISPSYTWPGFSWPIGICNVMNMLLIHTNTDVSLRPFKKQRSKSYIQLFLPYLTLPEVLSTSKLRHDLLCFLDCPSPNFQYPLETITRPVNRCDTMQSTRRCWLRQFSMVSAFHRFPGKRTYQQENLMRVMNSPGSGEYQYLDASISGSSLLKAVCKSVANDFSRDAF